MAEADLLFRVQELERRVTKNEGRLNTINLGEVRTDIHYVKDDIREIKQSYKALDLRLGRIIWLLVTTMATLGGSAVIVALSVRLG